MANKQTFQILFYIFIVYIDYMQKSINPMSQNKQAPYYQIKQGLVKTQFIKPYACKEYEFFSILKFNQKAISIYLHYFTSIFKKTTIIKQQKQKPILSDFFHVFLEIAFLKTICKIGKLSSVQQLIMNDILDQSLSQKDYEFLQKQIKPIIHRFHDSDYKKLCMKDKKKQICFEDVAKSFQYIDDVIKKFQEKLSNQVYYQSLIQNEHFPYELDSKDLKRQIIGSFKSIRNFKFLSINSRKQGIQRLIKGHENCFHMKIQHKPRNFVQNQKQINDDDDQDDKVDSDLDTQGKRSFIAIPKFQSQSLPIISKLQTYLQCSSMDDRNFLHDTSRSTLMQNIIKNIIQQSTKYTSKTRSFYPSISLSDIYFDQKKLRSFISQQKLILYGVGYSEDIFNFQMKLINGMTPNIVENQKCHLEYYSRIQILLNKICYFPSKSEEEGKYQQNDDDEEQQQRDNNQNEDLDLQEEKRVGKLYEYNVGELNETVHVWRLINIFYYILKLQRLNMHLYNTYDEEGDLQVNLSKRFFMKKYRRVLKKCYQMMEKGDISVPQLFSYEEQIPNVQKNKAKQWKFNMKSLRNIYNFQENDSMMESLQFTRIQAQFFARSSVLKQIVSILGHQCFKNLINPKKYFLTFFINAMEYFYENKRIIQLSQRKELSRRQIIISLGFQYKKTALDLKQFSKGNSKIFKMLKSYNERVSSDLYKMYIDRHRQEYICAKEIYQNFNKAIKLQQQVRIQQIRIQNLHKPKSLQFQVQFHYKEEQFSNTIDFFYNYCMQHKMLSHYWAIKFFERQFTNLSPQQQDLASRIILKQLIVLIKVYLTLNQQNWKEIQNFYLPLIIIDENKKIKNKQKIKMSEQLFQKYWKNLQFVENRINYDEVTRKITNEWQLLKKDKVNNN